MSPDPNSSEFSIVTYDPGQWRAAITRMARGESFVKGDKVRSVVTPDDCASESEAELAAQKLIKKAIIKQMLLRFMILRLAAKALFSLFLCQQVQ